MEECSIISATFFSMFFQNMGDWSQVSQRYKHKLNKTVVNINIQLVSGSCIITYIFLSMSRELDLGIGTIPALVCVSVHS